MGAAEGEKDLEAAGPRHRQEGGARGRCRRGGATQKLPREASRLKSNPEVPVVPEGCTHVLSSALAAILCICALTEASMIFGVEDEDFLSGVEDA